MLVAVGGTGALVYFGLVWYRFARVSAITRLAQVGIGVILLQSVMGALAVLFVNPTSVLAMHLGFSLLALSAAVILALEMGHVERWGTEGAWAVADSSPRPFPDSLRRWIWGAWIYTYGAIYLGSYVAFRNAGAACLSWPVCPPQWPPWQSAADLDLVHRLVAVGLLAVVLPMWFRIRQADRVWLTLKRGADLLVLAVGVQIISGAVLVESHLALWAYTIHVGLVMVLFALVSDLVWEISSLRSNGVLHSATVNASKFR